MEIVFIKVIFCGVEVVVEVRDELSRMVKQPSYYLKKKKKSILFFFVKVVLRYIEDAFFLLSR